MADHRCRCPKNPPDSSALRDEERHGPVPGQHPYAARSAQTRGIEHCLVQRGVAMINTTSNIDEGRGICGRR